MRGSDTGDEFEGFLVDLMNKIAEKTGVTYETRLVSDGKYGQRLAGGEWTGMIGEVKDEVSVLKL